MDHQENIFDFDNERFADIIMLFYLQLQQQEKTDKMLNELDKELRLTNRFFPNSQIIEAIQSLSTICSLEIKRGTKLFRCRLIDKEEEYAFLQPLKDALAEPIKKFVPDFDENAGMEEGLKASMYFSQHPDERCKLAKAYQPILEHYSKPSFWGYNKDESDAPPPGCPISGSRGQGLQLPCKVV